MIPLDAQLALGVCVLIIISGVCLAKLLEKDKKKVKRRSKKCF